MPGFRLACLDAAGRGMVDEDEDELNARDIGEQVRTVLDELGTRVGELMKGGSFPYNARTLIRRLEETVRMFEEDLEANEQLWSGF